MLSVIEGPIVLLSDQGLVLAGIFDTMKDLLGEAETALRAIVVVLVIWSVIETYNRSKSWWTTLGVLLIGGLAVWGVSNVDFFEDQVGEEVNDSCRGDCPNG